MIRSRPVYLLILLFAGTIAFGQEAPAFDDVPYIEVTGTSEMEIVPDEIYIAINLEERQDGREKSTIEQQETKLKEALQKIGVPLDDLFLSDAKADYIRIKWKKKDVVAKADYMLKVGNALTLAKVFEQLDELKIEDAYISKVSHSKIEEFRKEIKIKAIKAAKDKSDYLLTAIGEYTGKALVVKEHVVVDRATHSVGNFEMYYHSLAGASDKMIKEIQFQKIKLKASIYVKFEIKR